jgi:predicted O-methyltransferase YrrM
MAFRFTEDWFTDKIPLFRRFLDEFAGKPVRALEIGSFEGRSTTWLLTNILTHWRARLLCVDIQENPLLRANLRNAGGRWKTTIRIGPSGRVMASIPPNSLHFAYIDGSHWTCDVLEDAVTVFRRTRRGGIIAFDDYLWDDPAHNKHGVPKPAIDFFLLCNAHKLQILEHGYQVWVRKIAN